MFGVMQGRLSKSLTGKIQEFPTKTWRKEFELADQLGIRAIEWTLDYADLKLNPIFNLKEYYQIRSLQDQYLIQIPSITLDCFVDAPFYKRNELTGLKSDTLDLLWIAENLQHTDVNILVLPIVAQSGVFNQNHLFNLIRCLNSIEPGLSKTKKRVAIECEFDINLITILLNELSPDCFGVNFDMGNSASLGHNPEEELSVCRNRILNIHIKDRQLGGHTVKLGNGDVNFDKIAELLNDQEYDGNMILQAARDFATDELDLIASYMDFCRQFGWVGESIAER
jgi:L-ribulose-5-phosphate 3-epimerase